MSDEKASPRPKRRGSFRAPLPAAPAPEECRALERDLPRFFELARALANDVRRLERAVGDGDYVEAMQLLQVLMDDQALCDSVEDNVWLRIRERYTEWLSSRRTTEGAPANAREPG